LFWCEVKLIFFLLSLSQRLLSKVIYFSFSAFKKEVSDGSEKFSILAKMFSISGNVFPYSKDHPLAVLRKAILFSRTANG